MSNNDKKKNANDNYIENTHKRIEKIRWLELGCTGALLLMIFISLIRVVDIQLTAKESDYQKAAEILSTYTGIILGFVAMAVSLIGMVLSFYNTVRTEESNLESTKEFTKLSNALDKIEDLEVRLSMNLNSLNDKMNNFGEYQNKLNILENNLYHISKDISMLIDQSKGNCSENVNYVKPVDSLEKTKKEIKTDDDKINEEIKTNE